MAKVIPSAAISRASGKIGGITFSRGPFGDVIVAKSIPINSESIKQLGIRSGFQALTKRWAQTLTATQQAGWVALAAAHKVPDVFGNLITLTGVQFYIKLNGSLRAISAAPIDTAPGALATGAPGALTISAQASGTPHFTVSPAVAPAGNEVPVLWSLHAVNIGAHALLRKLTTVKVMAAGAGGPWAILTEWNQQFGRLQTGMVVVIKVQYTANDTGFQGVAYQASAIVT